MRFKLSRRITAALLAIVLHTGCKKELPETDDSRKGEVGSTQPVSQETRHEDARKSEIQRFYESSQPFGKQLKSFVLRLEYGITLDEYRQKLGTMADAYAEMIDPPAGEETCFDIAKRFKLALQHCTNAYEALKTETEDAPGHSVERDRTFSLNSQKYTSGSREHRIYEASEKRQAEWKACREDATEGLRLLELLRAASFSPTVSHSNLVSTGSDIFASRALMGYRVDNEGVKKLLNEFGSSPTVSTFDATPNCPKFTYYSFKPKGISFCFRADLLETIVLYSEGADGFWRYRGKLPFNLSFLQSREQVEKMLGKPEKAGEGIDNQSWARYESRGFLINYDGHESDMNARIASIVVYLPR